MSLLALPNSEMVILFPLEEDVLLVVHMPYVEPPVIIFPDLIALKS